MNIGWLIPCLLLCAVVTVARDAASLPALDTQGAPALSSFLAEAVSRGDVPGVVVLVAAPDRVLYYEAFGKMNVAQGIDMRKDAIFRIASMTKPLTSVAVMMLVEDGKLALDDEVSKYVPALKNPQVISRLDLAAGAYETRPSKHPITIRQLLTHTSGIGYCWSDPGLAMIAKLTGRTNEPDLPLLHEPGEKWTYGAGPRVLGDVIEKLSGHSFETFLDDRILRPLAMLDTGYAVSPSKNARVVTLHRRQEGRLVEIPNPATISAQRLADGRLFSTAADYCRFVQMILNDGQAGSARLLKPETVREMTRNQIGTIKIRLQPSADISYAKPFPLGAGQDAWGLGFQLATPARPDPATRRPGSLSWAGVNNTFFWIDPQEKIGVIVLMQQLPFYDQAALGVLGGVEARVYQHLRRR